VITVVLLGLLAAAWGVYRLDQHSAPATSPKLNLLLITLDTTRADHLGCYGDTAAHTPNLDQLAAEGTRFSQCDSCSPLTLPSHASIMTAVSPFVHGARQNGTAHVSAPNLTLAEALLAAGYRTQAAIASFVLNRQFGLVQGFEVYHDLAPGNTENPLQSERRADAVCDDAINLLCSHAAEPFFLWVHFYDPHFPYRSATHPDFASPEAYADEITFMDQHIGRLLAELRGLNLDSRTLIVAVGDHGEDLGQHGEPTHGYFLYQTTVHVPLIIRCPIAIEAGRIVSTPVRTIDIAPTILELLGCPEMSNVEGVSLCTLLHGGNLQPPLPAYAETFEANRQFGFSPLRSLRLDDWKFILAPRSELYDLRNDPAETSDLLSDHPEEASKLRQELSDFVARAPPPLRSFVVAELTSADRSHIEALGYVGAGAVAHADIQAELELLEPRGDNPRDHADLLRLHFQAHESLKQERFSEAEEGFRRLVAATPSAPQLHASLARALRGQRRFDEAIESAEAALALAPNDTHIRGIYGSLLSEVRRWEEAVEQFRLVLDSTPRDAVILHGMGIALTSLDRLDEADAQFQLALDIDYGNPRLLHALGVLRSRQGRPEEAVACFRKALAIDPTFAQAAHDLQLVEQNLKP
jgi:arylsulfatase A-like enzyme/Flp pilus assembly protein TadD